MDSLRYYLCASTSFGADVNFSEPALIAMHNSELADIVGNLVHRILNLCIKYCGGCIPDAPHDPAFPPPFDLPALLVETARNLEACTIHANLFKAMDAARSTNRSASVILN